MAKTKGVDEEDNDQCPMEPASWQRGSSKNINIALRDCATSTDLGTYPPEDEEKAQRQLDPTND